MRRILALCVLLLVVGSQAAFAETPRTISYQGVLLEEGGTYPVPDGDYEITFRLYAQVSGGDINAVYADDGLTGGATSGDAHLNVGAGTGISVNADSVNLDTSYTDGRYVNEGQSNSVTSSMITDSAIEGADISSSAAIQPSKISGTAWTSTNDGAGSGLDADKLDGQEGSYYRNASNLSTGTINEARLPQNAIDGSEIEDGTLTGSDIQGGSIFYNRLANPLEISYSIWDWTLGSSASKLRINKTTQYEAMEVENSSSGGVADCLYLKSTSTGATASTAVLVASTYSGRAGWFGESTDDNEYAVEIWSPSSTSEGLYVRGSVYSTGSMGSAVQTSLGREAVFTVESPEVEVYCSGSAYLVGGAAQVSFDRLFTESVSSEVDVRVTVTPVGGWSGLYVESASPKGFYIRSGAGDDNVKFDWMACGRKKGCDIRPDAAFPDTYQELRARELMPDAMGADVGRRTDEERINN